MRGESAMGPLDLKAIFTEALARPEGLERSAYLDAACQEDVALRAQIEALLRAHDAAGRFLQSSVDDGPEMGPADPSDRTTGLD